MKQGVLVTIREEPLKSRRKESAIISRATLDRQRGAFERLMAIVLLFVSFAGTIAVVSGGWAALISAPRIGAIAIGVAIQIGLTAAEWWYGYGRGPWRYRLALSADTGLTVGGYGPLLAPALAVYLATHIGTDWALPLAWAILVLASFWLAWYPEHTLIE